MSPKLSSSPYTSGSVFKTKVFVIDEHPSFGRVVRGSHQNVLFGDLENIEHEVLFKCWFNHSKLLQILWGPVEFPDYSCQSLALQFAHFKVA